MFLGTVWACPDCMLKIANDEANPDRPADRPPVLALILNGQRLSLGMPDAEHADTCTPTDRALTLCECDRIRLSPEPCQTCGDTYGGTRHALTLEQDDRYRTLRPWELHEEGCWICGYPACAGTLTFDDRGPFQLIACRSLRCRNGHRWTRDTDGG